MFVKVKDATGSEVVINTADVVSARVDGAEKSLCVLQFRTLVRLESPESKSPPRYAAIATPVPVGILHVKMPLDDVVALLNSKP
jgi:hypothetical protein